MDVMASDVPELSIEISLLPQDDIMGHARFDLGHAAKDAFPCFGPREPLSTDLAPAAPGRDRFSKVRAHLRNGVAGFKGKLDYDSFAALVLYEPVRI